jgi:hypothetical protein
MQTMKKTILSFYCDDTNPYCAPPEAFKILLDFAASEGIAGEASVILGYEWSEHGLISRPTTDIQSTYLGQVRRAYSCGIDSHFELMTHGGLFDFERTCIPSEAIHEGLWLFEPAVTVAEYEAYFFAILSEGERAGVRFTGLTQPGCGCDACVHRHQELRSGNQSNPNPKVWQALLSLVKKEKFRGRTVPCFFGGALEHGSACCMASDGVYGVYNLPPNMEDRFGKWFNSPEYVDEDYYITANGQSGRIVDLVRAQAPYSMFYSHWQGLNPVNGVGWKAFTRVVQRVEKHLHEEVIWMRPSEFTDHITEHAIMINNERSSPHS